VNLLLPLGFEIKNGVIIKVPVEFDRKLFHHEEHEDHERK
jgi:hypothetical protein